MATFSYARLLCASLLLLLSYGIVPAQDADGWSLLLSNRFDDAERTFRRSLANDPKDARSALGLSMTYEAQRKSADAHRWLLTAIRGSSDPYTLLNASQLSERLRVGLRTGSDLMAVYRDVTSKPDPLGIQKAVAYTALADGEEQRGEAQGSRKWHDMNAPIRSWRLIGPFENISASGYERVFPPEKEDSPEATYEGVSGARIRWHEPSVTRNDGWIDMARYFPSTQSVFYAVTYVESSKEQRVHIRLGTSGAFKLWLNDQLVDETFEEHNNDLDTYISEVTLAKGWNKVLVKLASSEIPRCNFLLRITDANGQALELPAQTEPKPVPSVRIQSVIQANPFVSVLKDRIRTFPNQPEHRLLLAETYLRNDQAALAEEVLLEALEAHPRSYIVLDLLAEAYSRSNRSTEAESTVDLMEQLAPELPSILVRKLSRFLDQDRTDDAEELLQQLGERLPESEMWFDAALAIAKRKNRLQDINELTVRAFELHPDNVGYTSANVVMALRGPKRIPGAIAIVNRHLETIVTESGIMMLANLYKEDGNLDEWNRQYDRLLAINPAAPGYFVQRSETYAGLKDFPSAIAEIRKALDIAPTVSSLWMRAGTLYQALFDKAGADASFKRALEADPANFEAREALRDLNGQPSPWSLLPSAPVDSVISMAPSPADFPDDDAVVLLDDVRRIVYDGSRSEVLADIVLKILTVEGIDRFKEWYIPYDGDGSVLLEKAVVLKANGREIQADRSGRELVFKSLEPGDIIHVRYRAREYRYGTLHRHFWADYSFDAYLPTLFTRVSLIVPPHQPFQWKALNATIAPTTSTTALGTMYTWQTANMPAIEVEDGMPGYGEIGKQVLISSIPDWGILSEWYYDIARPKTRSTYEIRKLMDSLAPRSAALSEQIIIERVYKYITSEVRYSSVPFRQSGIIPQKARDVFATRIGDCKDVATLCISMLQERGIAAWHVLVRTNTSPLQPELLPSVTLFDHAIVAVETARGRLFLDLTADDMPIGSIPFADVDAFCLLIKPGEKAPFRLTRELFKPNNVVAKTTVEIRPDNSARIVQQLTHTGARSQMFRSRFRNQSEKERQKSMLESLSSDFPDVTLDRLTITGIDTLSDAVSYTMEFTVPDFLIEAADARIFRIPWYWPFEPNEALSYEQRKHPYDFFNYRDTIIETVAITMPDGFNPQGLAPTFSASHDVASSTITSSVAGSSLNLKRQSVFNRSWVDTKEYQSYKTFYNSVVKHDRRYVLLMPSPSKRPPSKQR